MAATPVPVAEPEIDVRPWSRRNRLNPFSRGLLPVALLGDEEFAVADVDRSTLRFGPDGAAPKHRRHGFVWDLNRDGEDDLLLHFRIPDTGIAVGDGEACPEGVTQGGVPFRACDEIDTTFRAPWWWWLFWWWFGWLH